MFICQTCQILRVVTQWVDDLRFLAWNDSFSPWYMPDSRGLRDAMWKRRDLAWEVRGVEAMIYGESWYRF